MANKDHPGAAAWDIAINSCTGPLFPRDGKKVSLLNLHESGWILADPEKS